MGRYLYDTDDLNNPVRLLETASVILCDLEGSLGTIADLLLNAADGGEPTSELDNQTLAGLMRMLQSGAQLAKDKLDAGTVLSRGVA